MKVMLIHGRDGTPWSLFSLGWRLSQQQHDVYYFGYDTFFESFESITTRFAETVRTSMEGGEPYVIVGHSLGGVIARASLPYLADKPPYHLIMLAPPNKPSVIAKLMQWNPFHWCGIGDAGQKLVDETFYQTLPKPNVPTTIIAGMLGFKGPFSFFGVEPNDTILAVKETEIDEGVKAMLAKETHVSIMSSPQIVRIVSELMA